MKAQLTRAVAFIGNFEEYAIGILCQSPPEFNNKIFRPLLLQHVRKPYAYFLRESPPLIALCPDATKYFDPLKQLSNCPFIWQNSANDFNGNSIIESEGRTTCQQSRAHRTITRKQL